MSLIDGVGDEVTEFFLIVTIILIGVGAWWSTAINHRFRIRTVLILEHRRNSISANVNNQSLSVSTTSRNTTNNTPTERLRASNTSAERISETESHREGETANSETITAENQTDEEIEQNNIVQTMDADTNTLRKRRLAYFQENASSETSSDLACGEPQVTTTKENDTSENSKNDNLTEAQATTSSSSNNFEQQDRHNAEEILKSTDGELIRIKLKYLNDDIKSVEGKLLEKLGDFKRRHFEVELAACKIIRLIFNGQVLQKDGETLKDCGLFDNCVVHCLVHQRPAGSQSNTSSNRDDLSSSSSSRSPYNSNIFGTDNGSSYLGGVAGLNGAGSNANGDHRDNATLPWDLGNVLLALITLILAVAWYFRFEYAQLFTVTATVFLMCLTGIFTLLLIGLLCPDTSSAQQQTASTNTTNNNTQSQPVS